MLSPLSHKEQVSQHLEQILKNEQWRWVCYTRGWLLCTVCVLCKSANAVADHKSSLRSKAGVVWVNRKLLLDFRTCLCLQKYLNVKVMVWEDMINLIIYNVLSSSNCIRIAEKNQAVYLKYISISEYFCWSCLEMLQNCCVSHWILNRALLLFPDRGLHDRATPLPPHLLRALQSLLQLQAQLVRWQPELRAHPLRSRHAWPQPDARCSGRESLPRGPKAQTLWPHGGQLWGKLSLRSCCELGGVGGKFGVHGDWGGSGLLGLEVLGHRFKTAALAREKKKVVRKVFSICER